MRSRENGLATTGNDKITLVVRFFKFLSYPVVEQNEANIFLTSPIREYLMRHNVYVSSGFDLYCEIISEQPHLLCIDLSHTS